MRTFDSLSICYHYGFHHFSSKLKMRLGTNDGTPIRESSILSFNIIRVDRKDVRRNGGVDMYVRSNLKCKILRYQLYLFVEIKFHGHDCFMIDIRPTESGWFTNIRTNSGGVLSKVRARLVIE
jgi:hypothetical protein